MDMRWVWTTIWQVAPGNYSGPLHHCATYRMGVCEICKEKTSVTEPRGYGHVVRDWKWRYEVDCKRSQ
jgi:hypothetical protein